MFQEQEFKQWGDDLTNLEKGTRRGQAFVRGLCCITLPMQFFGGGIEVQGRAVALLMLVFWAFFTHDLFCLYFLYAWLAGMVAYKLTTTKRVHSLFPGWPFLSLLGFGYWSGVTLQTALVTAAGYLLLPVAPFLGMLLLGSGVGCAADLYMGWWQRRKEIIVYRDAQHEMANRREAYKRRW